MQQGAAIGSFLYEPESDAAQQYAIAEVRWIDLRQPDTHALIL